MKEIFQLSQRIHNEASHAVPKGTGCIWVNRNRSSPADLAGLPALIRIDLENLLAQINQVIPDDFAYDIYLGGEFPVLEVSYNNGAQTIVNYLTQ